MARRFVLGLAALTVTTVLAVPPLLDRGDLRRKEQVLPLVPAAHLEAFSSCEALRGYFEEQAERLRVAVSALPVPGAGVAEARAPAASASFAPAGGAGLTGRGGPAPSYTGTNVQVAGVDEADWVKTNGRLIAVAALDRLWIVDAGDGRPRVAGSLELPEGGSHELFLTGDRAVVFTRSFGFRTPEARGGGGEGGADVLPSSSVVGPGRTVVSIVDLSGPGAPRVSDRRVIEGTYTAARLVGDRIRFVLQSPPPYVGVPEQTRDRGLDAWLPSMGRPGEALDEPVVACEDVRRPAEPSGLGTTTVLTIDPARGAAPVHATTVVADAQTVYASQERLYVATTRWQEPDRSPQSVTQTTEVHAFDISQPDAVRYLASGRVPGRLLNQFALDEHRGHLRVATTVERPRAVPVPTGPAGPEEVLVDRVARPDTESVLTVLARRGDRLEQVGRVSGLGRGEDIQAVRFLGDLGFVVTFRRIDPLYALDLSDPEAPRVLGELKVEGFSAYLHPVGAGRLIGVGQDADSEGRTLGTQVSLFDVSDPTRPTRLEQFVLRGAASAVEWDHRAFLWWATGRLGVVPTYPVGDEVVTGDAAQGFAGAVVFRVRGDRLELIARVAHPDGDPILRSLVIDGTLYTVSESGVMSSDSETLDRLGFAAFSV